VLLGANQRDRLTARPSPAGATDAMDVIFRHAGKLEIHDVGQVFDIKAARGDIGRHQHANLSRLEVGKRLKALRLALVAMDGGGMNAVTVELVCEAIGADAGGK